MENQHLKVVNMVWNLTSDKIGFLSPLRPNSRNSILVHARKLDSTMKSRVIID